MGLIAIGVMLGGAGGLSVWRQPPHPDPWRTVGEWDLLNAGWWSHPLERNAFKRLVIQGGLTDVTASADGQRVWAVGEGELIVHSGDGGRSWRQQHPAPAQDGAPPNAAHLLERLLPSAHAAKGPESGAPQQQQQQQQQQQRPLPGAGPREPVDGAAASAPAAASSAPTPAVSAAPGPGSTTAAAGTRSATRRPLADPSRRLHAVTFVDDLRGWAVGHAGTVLVTADGGATWKPQVSGVDVALLAVAFLADGQRGWAAGDLGVLLATTDGGRNWRRLATGVDTVLNGLHAATDGLRLWAVTGAGVLASRDAGRSWADVSPDERAGVLHDLRGSPDGQRLWAVGEGGRLLTSTDEGRSWVTRRVGEMDLTKVCFSADAKTGWAVGLGGVAISRDAGISWNRQEPVPHGLFLGVACPATAGGAGWVVGPEGTLLRSLDEGASWQVMSEGLRLMASQAVLLRDGRRGWMVTAGGAILFTANAGRSWQVQALAPGGLGSLSVAADGTRAWAGGADLPLVSTRDGGRTWQPSPATEAPRAVQLGFDDAGQRGWAADANGNLFLTGDGGQRWQPQATSEAAVAPWTRWHFMPDGQRGWKAAADASPRFDISLSTTADGGKTWAPAGRLPVEALIDLVFAPDGRRGWVVGGDAIAATADGGVTWQRQPGTEGWIRKLHPGSDGHRAWAVGAQGTVLATLDGGRSWMAQRSGTRAALTWVGFLPDGQRGLVLGSGGTVLVTENGGLTWRETAHYERYPAPWALVCLLLSAMVLSVAVATGSLRQDEEGGEPLPQVQPELRGDRPLTQLKDDRLNHAPAVRALAGFILNRDTDPRLTIAITAPWGMGKSSMMGMLRTELESQGFRTAWFNAWHHQQEGRQLTALFNAIRQQAVPSVFRQPVAALRVRLRLLWLRGWLYRMALVLLALLVLDVGMGWRGSGVAPGEFLRLNINHHWLDTPRVAITPHSLELLNPFNGRQAGICAAGAKADTKGGNGDAKDGPRLRPEVFCFLRAALTRPAIESGQSCQDPREIGAQRCVFASKEKLLSLVNRSLYGEDATRYLMAGERQAIADAVEPVAPPSMTPTILHFLPLLALLGVLMTKGLAVYGIELLRPLRMMLAPAPRSDAGSEPAGTIERYRREFGLLTDALDGRLVVFIDDLDRCDSATVNSLLEITNYLVDHGRCFLVLGADMDKVKACIEPRVKTDDKAERSAYQTEYLRKLVHIEMPVPRPSDATLDVFLDGPKATGAASLVPAHWHWPRWLLALAHIVRDLVFVARDRIVSALPWMAMVLAAAGFAYAAVWMVSEDTPDRIEMPPPAASAPAGAWPASAALPRREAAGMPGGGALSLLGSGEAGLQQGQEAGLEAWWPLVAVSLLLLGAALQWRSVAPRLAGLWVALGGVLRTSDSAEFSQALGLWKAAVRLGDTTPRGIKRFVNRARLFAIHERKSQGATALRECHVVALTAMHHVQPSFIEALACDPGTSPPAPAHPVDTAQDGIDWWLRAGKAPTPDAAAADEGLRRHKLAACLTEHEKRFGRPDTAAVRRFRALLERISVR
ncbi:MAG: YCF48-related protein [Pseudomonadota bacterium]